MKTSSVAIWKKNRVIVAIAFGVWVTNVAFLVQGEHKYFSSPPSYRPGNSKTHLKSGIARVID